MQLIWTFMNISELHPNFKMYYWRIIRQTKTKLLLKGTAVETEIVDQCELIITS